MNSYEQIPFDWSLVDKLNPEVIVGQSEMKLVRSFVKMILNTDFQGLPQASFINRDFSKLLILFQATIKLLYTSQKQLQNMCNERTKKYKEAAEEIAKLKQTESNLRKHLHSEQCQGETCPLCKKRFRNLEYIDKHIKNRHIERLAAWEYVRGFTDSLTPDSKNINDNKAQQESKKPILKFMNCSSITIESSMPLKAKKETRYFELDEEEVQPNNNDNFGYNNYNKNQVPPIQADLAKTPHAQNGFDNNQHQILPDDSLIDNGNNINQIGISNNDQIAKSQMDMITNRATSNIINGYKEIAESHKTHYSTPQTPKENPSKRDKNGYKQLPPNSPLANPNYPKSKTPDQGKHPKIVTNQPEEEEQTPVQRKHHHHRQQQQQYEPQQQQLQIQQESKNENRPQTPPAISCRKSQNDNEQENRPSTTGSAIQEGQKHQRRQQKYQQQQQQLQMQQQQQLQQQIQQQQIQMQQMQQQQQQLQQQLQIQQQQQLQQQLQMQQMQQKQQQIQIQQKQPPPEESKLENEENDPFLLENDDENAEIEKTENTNHIEFTTAQLDDLIQRSDNEEGNEEVEVRTQTPKKRRKKRRTVIPMPEGVIPQNDSTSQSTTTTVSTNNPQEVKFNFKGTKGVIQQHELQETDMINENQKIKVAKKPSVTFINADDNFDDGASIRPVPQQQRKDHVEIGIVKRIDAEPFIENIKPAAETRNSSRNETKNIKRMGGYDIPNSELENLIKESSSQYDEYNE